MKLSPETYQHIISLLQFYAESSSGREPENKEANDKAWDELTLFFKEQGGGYCFQCSPHGRYMVEGVCEECTARNKKWDEENGIKN